MHFNFIDTIMDLSFKLKCLKLHLKHELCKLQQFQFTPIQHNLKVKVPNIDLTNQSSPYLSKGLGAGILKEWRVPWWPLERDGSGSPSGDRWSYGSSPPPQPSVCWSSAAGGVSEKMNRDMAHREELGFVPEERNGCATADWEFEMERR